MHNYSTWFLHAKNVISVNSILQDDKQIFAAKYQLYLPTEEELILELEREKQILKITTEDKG